MKPRNKAFGSRLQHLRKRSNLTQTDAANQIGLSYKALQDHEAGRVPNPNNLQKYLDFYGCSKVWLLTGEGEQYPGGEKQDLPLVGEEKEAYTAAQELPGMADPMIQAIAGVKEIFDSRNTILIQALTLNIAAFQMASRTGKQIYEQKKDINDLRDLYNNLKNQISLIEFELKNHMTPKTGAATGSKET